MKSLKAYDIAIIAIFASLMAIGANLTAYLVIGAVPVTLQTFFAILAGLLLGSKRGAIAMVVYTMIGLAGAPVFAEFSGGLGVILKSTFGFILSFILVAFVTGKIVERYTNPKLPTFLIASFIGLIINYVVGTHYMYFALKLWAGAPDGFSYAMVWSWMAAPLVKDIIVTTGAAMIAPRIYKAVKKTTNSSRPLNNPIA